VVIGATYSSLVSRLRPTGLWPRPVRRGMATPISTGGIGCCTFGMMPSICVCTAENPLSGTLGHVMCKYNMLMAMWPMPIRFFDPYAVFRPCKKKRSCHGGACNGFFKIVLRTPTGSAIKSFSQSLFAASSADLRWREGLPCVL
jgi:hypothetical protein